MKQLNPCTNCGCRRIGLSIRQGVTGRVVKTHWYREIITCKQCGIQITAKSPDTGVKLWNRANQNVILETP